MKTLKLEQLKFSKNGEEIKLNSVVDHSTAEALEAIENVKDEVIGAIPGLRTEIAVERERINNLTSLSEGSTTGDAELIDVRIGADGEVYNTAGDAVRGQYRDIMNNMQETESRLSESINDISDGLESITFRNLCDKSKLVRGKYFDDKSNLIDNNNSWYYDEFIPVKAGVEYERTSIDRAVQIVTFDGNKSLIGRIFNSADVSNYTFSDNVVFIKFSIYNAYEDEIQGFVFATYNDFQYLSNENIYAVNGDKVADKTIGAVKIKDGDIGEDKTAFFYPTSNILNPLKCQKDRWIDSTIGLQTKNGCEISHYIGVKQGDIVHFTPMSALYIAKYETDGKYVRSTLSSTDTTFAVQTDGHIVFARYNSYFDENFMVSINRDLPTKYENFGTFTFKYKDDSGKQALEEIDTLKHVGYVDKTATQINIYKENLRFVINKYNRSDIRANLWRTNDCYYIDNGENIPIWYSSDSDGVVHLANEEDFLGGYHGDEIATSFHLFIDGIEYEENSVLTKRYFDELVIVCESDIYHCNTSDKANTVCFKRNKILTFNRDGMTVKNYWVAQETVDVTLAYFGMLSVERYVNGEQDKVLLNGFETNMDYKYRDNNTDTQRSKTTTEATMHTKYGDFCIRAKDMSPLQHYGGYVANYKGAGGHRLKVYLGVVNNGETVRFNSGDILRGEATYSYNN